MALVRRTAAVGRATVPASPASVPHQAPAPHPEPGSHQPPGAYAPPGSYPPPGSFPPPGSYPPGGEPAPGESAAAAPSQPAHGLAVIAGLGVAAIGGLGAMAVDMMVNPPVFQAQGGMSVFAALFVFAAAVERLLEPITRWMPGHGEQQHYERAVADMDNGVPGATQAVAQHKAAVDRARASRGVLMWGLATGVATLLSAAGGFYLLRMINVDPTGWSVVPPWLDALVTGLVVGSGTKPLHDLINRVQRQNSSTPV